jgi:tetratricopeptide (TPR) repeat protein
MATIEQMFGLAQQHHQAGRLPQAEQLYRQILDGQPGHAGALQYLGVIACQAGRPDAGVDLIRRAVAIAPDNPEARSNLGNALRDNGQFDQAIEAFRQAIGLRPNYPEAYHNLGNALKDKGEVDEAMAAYRQAIALRPNYAEAHNNLGIVLRDKGELDGAIAACRQAIAHRPNYPEAHNNLGIALRDKGQAGEAIAACRRAIGLRPNYPEAYHNLGNALKDTGRLEETIAAYRQAIAFRPDYAEAHNNLGNVLRDKGQVDGAIAAFRHAIALNPNLPEACCNLGDALREEGQLDEAIAACRQAIALRPDYVEGHYNLGIALQDKGRLEEAEAAYRRAIALRMDFVEAHNNLAFTLLLQGEFLRGWEEYEWRWKWKDFPSPRRDFGQPQWDGSDLNGRIVLLHAEQGFGDTIQFIRYATLVARRGASVVVECQPALKNLLQSNARGWQVIGRGEPLPAFDVHCPLLSLPLAFGTTLQSIPAEVPYLEADAEIARQWKERLAEDSGFLKVGLSWAGSSTHENDRNRSMSLSAFAPLARFHGIRFYSLQKGEAAKQANDPPGGMHLMDFSGAIHDFAESAGLIANLDLVISVDTAVVHLAGAMGKLVWVLLPTTQDWRWMREREDSPWYRTVRLFGQTKAGDWEDVVRRVSEGIPHFVETWEKTR